MINFLLLPAASSLGFSVGIGDGVLLTRLFFASVVFWFLTIQVNIQGGYASVFAIPTLILIGYAFAGRSAEEATLIALSLTPLLLVVPVVVSVLCARTCR